MNEVLLLTSWMAGVAMLIAGVCVIDIQAANREIRERATLG